MEITKAKALLTPQCLRRRQPPARALGEAISELSSPSPLKEPHLCYHSSGGLRSTSSCAGRADVQVSWAVMENQP